jgi:hypothetical protein
MGAEDAMQSIAGVAGGMHVYDDTPDTGGCDGSSSSDSWFDQIMGTRSLISTSPDRLVASGTGAGRGVYDRMQDEWELGSAGERLSAIASIYMAASLAHMGEFLCERLRDAQRCREQRHVDGDVDPGANPLGERQPIGCRGRRRDDSRRLHGLGDA